MHVSCHVMLYNVFNVMLYNMCHVMLYIFVCYITKYVIVYSMLHAM